MFWKKKLKKLKKSERKFWGRNVMRSKPLPKSKPSLAEVQRWMRWVITEPRGIREALTSPWTLDPALAHRYKEPDRQLRVIEEAAPLSTHDRLDVYANAYFYRLLESLGADYMAVHRVLGEERFHDLVAHYLMRYPSNSPNIGDLGEEFPRFIKDSPLSNPFPFLHELALLERAIMECLFTNHLPPLDVRSFQTKSEEDWATARFVLDPAIRLISVQWPVDTLWKRREQPEPLKLPAFPESAPRHLLLYRDDSWVNVSVMDVHPWTALHMLRSGMSLGAVCDTLSKQWSQRSEPLPVMEWFSSWVATGLVRNILWDELKGEQ
jgi:hypothetical protein